MPEVTAQNTQPLESNAAFATVLEEASGQNGQDLPLEALAQPAEPAAEGIDREETQPSAELSLAAAMFVIPLQPLIQNVEQAPPAQKAVAVQGSIQQAGQYTGQGQQVDRTLIEARPEMETAAMESADAESPAMKTAKTQASVLEGAKVPSETMTNVQSRPAADRQTEAKQKQVELLSDRSEVKEIKQKLEDTPVIDSVSPQNIAERDAQVSGKGEAAGQLGEGVDPVRRAGAGQIHAPAARKTEKARTAYPEAPIAASVAVKGAAFIQQAQDAQAVQSAASETAVREEPPALQVAKATMAALKRGATEYKLRLKPEGLGQVDVTVSAKGSEITLSMKTDNEAAKGLILGHADELRTELRAQNYQINGLTVEVGMDNQGGSESFASGQHAQQAFERGRTTAEQPYTQPAETQAPLQQRPQPAPRSGTINYRI